MTDLIGPPPLIDAANLGDPAPRSRSGPESRTLISWADRRRMRVRVGFGVLQVVVLAGLVVASILPLLWLFLAAISTTQDVIRHPFGLWPSTPQWGHFWEAWDGLHLDHYMLNTVFIIVGNVVINVVICTTGAYVLSVLRPRWGKFLSGAILATLFIPGIVALVPLYLTIIDVPGLDINLMNTFWAVWLPAAANAFNVLIIKRFFDALPRELFEAARVDGVGPLRLLTSIVLPLSKPILGVVALLTAVGAYKEYLWPLLVLPDTTLQPISVALPRMEHAVELSVMLAALFLSLIVPVLLFLAFQRQFLRSVALSSGLKG